MDVRLVAIIVLVLVCIAVIVFTVYYMFAGRAIRGVERVALGEVIYLPLPRKVTNVTLIDAMLYRRSIRDYTGEPITIMELSMILWAAQGINEVRYGFRTAPSAGATYPLELYVVVGNKTVKIDEGSYLEAGVYKYDIERHALILVKRGDYRAELARAALDQPWVRDAAVDIVVCAVYERTTRRYGERGYRYVHMEVGHVGQNIYLMAAALDLGTVAVGAFYDEDVARIIGAEPNEHPLYIMPVGRPVKPYRITFEEIHRYYERNRGG